MTDTETSDWQQRAVELREHDVPKRRAQVVALREQGLIYQDIADELGLDRSGISQHLDAYREQLAAAHWLTEHAPDAEEL